MEFIPGNTATDAVAGYGVHKGQIPRIYRNIFYRSVARYHVGRFIILTPSNMSHIDL